jgi:hypothetical protein
MKYLFPKILFIIFLLTAITSFVFLNNPKETPKAEIEDVGNVRFNTEMENGFMERESGF